jgi:hypothetical protein
VGIVNGLFSSSTSHFLGSTLVAAGLTAVQFNNVDKESKANKKLILDKHHQVSADLTDLTVKLASEISKLEKSSTTGTRI